MKTTHTSWIASIIFPENGIGLKNHYSRTVICDFFSSEHNQILSFSFFSQLKPEVPVFSEKIAAF